MLLAAVAADSNAASGRGLDRLARPLVGGGDPEHPLPHCLPAIGRDEPEQRPAGEELERRVEDERIRRLGLRYCDGACRDLEELLVGALREAARLVGGVDVVGVDVEAGAGRSSEVPCASTLRPRPNLRSSTNLRVRDGSPSTSRSARSPTAPACPCRRCASTRPRAWWRPPGHPAGSGASPATCCGGSRSSASRSASG